MSLSEDSTDNDFEVAAVLANGVVNSASQWNCVNARDENLSSSTSTSALDFPVRKSLTATITTNGSSKSASEAVIDHHASMSVCQLAGRGELSMLRRVLNEDNMNRSDENSRTPLMYAVGSGWSHVVQLLLERGADTGSVDEHGSTALMHACSLGLPTIVRQLLDSRATVNDVCLKGNTALHYAAFCNNFECVQLLLDAGADLTIENSGGLTPAMLAAHLGHREAQDIIFSYVRNVLMEGGDDTST